VTDDQIRERYGDQARQRNRLAAVSLLEAAEADLPLPEVDLQAWERRVLWTYLDDTERKLATFTPLLERVQLLREIVNARFLFKQLSIDRARGFRFKTEAGDELGAASLSSGEQHELVLTYDLLFNVQPGSLVLIDEPEISLHVSWQRSFLDDLLKVAELQSLRFVVATHSPQVIGKWWPKAAPLYEKDSVPNADRTDADD
jgi:predicted ATP-binding protein involved in virulence